MMLRRRRRAPHLLVSGAPPVQFDVMAYEDLDIMAYEPDNWLDPNFLQRIPLTIKTGQVPSTQTDFPLLINATFPELIGKSLDELRFASTDNIQLEYEIVTFNSAFGTLEVWIKKPTVSDGDIIFIYFDNSTSVDEQNPSAVWSNNFVVVQHFNEASGNILDSTANNNDMTPLGSPTNATGKIGNAKNLPVSSDSYFIDNNETLKTTDITVTAWTKIPDAAGVRTIIGKWENPIDNDWLLFVAFDALAVFLTSDNILNIGSISENVFHHVAFTIVGTTTINMYIDGDLEHTQTVTAKTPASTSRLQIGKANSSPLEGIIDEIHMSNDGKSSDWIKTEYNNQNDNSAFYTTGAVESVPTVFDTMAYEVVA